MLLKDLIKKYGENFDIDEDKIKEFVKKQSAKYIPEYGDRYFYVNSYGCVDIKFLDDTDRDAYLIRHNYAFRTQEECEEYRYYLELLDEYTFEPNWKDSSQEKWFIYYNSEEDELNCSFNTGLIYNFFCFESQDKLIEFVKLVGEENVKRFMFDIWE